MFPLLYLDPGTGSYILQALMAGALGIVFFFKNIRTKIMIMFGFDKKDENNDDTKNQVQ